MSAFATLASPKLSRKDTLSLHSVHALDIVDGLPRTALNRAHREQFPWQRLTLDGAGFVSSAALAVGFWLAALRRRKSNRSTRRLATNVASLQLQDHRKAAQTMLNDVQNHFVEELESVLSNGVSSKGDFIASDWQRDMGLQGGGTRFGVVESPIFNRASVNYSSVFYDALPEKPVKSATALSVIIHPRNPHAPSMHCHFSYTEPRSRPAYWRMIADLNPSLHDPHAKNKFEVALKKHCPQELFDDGRLFGDKYFFIPELNMYRGTSHLFIAALSDAEMDPGAIRDLAKSLATVTIDTYSEIIQESMDRHPIHTVTQHDVTEQLAYHTAYFYQVLFLDCGTTAGLMAHSDNDVGTLASLPSYIDRDLLLSWLQDRVQPPHDVLLHRILDILPAGSGPCNITDDIRQTLATVVREYYIEDPSRTKSQADMDLQWWATRHNK